MTIAELWAMSARRSVLEQYAQAHDHFAEAEQTSAGRGHAIEAEGFHAFALTALLAYRAESDDPAPRMDLPLYADACPTCGGLGTVRIRTGNGGQRIPCSECDGAGTQRPGPRRKENR